MLRAFRNAVHAEIDRFHRLHVPPGERVLVVGPRAEEVLAATRARDGEACADFAEVRDLAERKPPPFDFILVTQYVSLAPDLVVLFRTLAPLASHRTRLLVDFYNYNFVWQIVLRCIRPADLARTKSPTWIAPRILEGILEAAGFELVTEGHRLLLPLRLPVLDDLFNRFLARLPYLNRFDLLVTFIARRPLPPVPDRPPSVTVVVTAKNERGNIAPTAERIPEMGSHTTILFVEGGSTDGTPEEIDRVIAASPGRDIRRVVQGGKGQGDAMHTGFRLAETDLILQFDSDLTIDPEVLPYFYLLLAEGKAEYVMATRAIYPKAPGAMRLLNRFGNWFFGLSFTWILGQRLTDTLGGVKGFRREDYPKLLSSKRVFGDIDPFGDFDLLFGAILSGLRIRELPVRYRARTYGEPQISRFRDGIRLLRITATALWKYLLRG